MLSSKLFDFNVVYGNRTEFLVLKNEIFTKHCYFTEIDTKNPRIVDVGAHIGLSTLYFKKQYPGAKILAIEPNPYNAKIFLENMGINGIKGVTLIEAMVSVKGGEETLYIDGGEEGWNSTSSVWVDAWNGKQKGKPIRVNSIELDSLLINRVDLLKLDIEGLEEEVLKRSSKLKMVDRIVLEFHPRKGNSLDRIKRILIANGFKLRVEGDEDDMCILWGERDVI